MTGKGAGKTDTAPLRLGTRRSKLARLQSENVARRIQALPGAPAVELVELSTRGDQLVDQPLTAALGKGFFTGEIEMALIEGRIDLAVHSLKDLATEDPPGLVIAAIPEREDPRDALVALDGTKLDNLPAGARVGTSSPRRKAFLLRHRPDLRPLDVRGNVPTRIAKLEAGNYDALILAAAGLFRLGMADRITEILPAERFPPAPGQGALAVQVRADDASTRRWVDPLDDLQCRIEVTAERAVLAELHAGCQAPVGALGRWVEGRLALKAGVAALNGEEVVERRLEQVVHDEERSKETGRVLGRRLLEQGAGAILERVRGARCA